MCLECDVSFWLQMESISNLMFSFSSADETPTELDALLAELEAALDALLEALAPLLGLTPEQVTQIEADFDTLIKDIEAIEHGEIDVDGGLEKVLQDIVNIIHDFGVQSQPRDEVEATSKPNEIADVFLHQN